MAALRRWLRTDLLVVGLYLGLTLVLTYPLVTHLTTHVPGNVTGALDEYGFLWNMWWFKHSIFDLRTNPLYSSFLFYPLGISLVLYGYQLQNALLSVPWQPFLSLAAINNILLVLTLTLSGYGTFLLLRYLLSTEKDTAQHSELIKMIAAFLGGTAYAFAASRFVYLALGHYNFVSSQWIPFYVLFLIKALRQPTNPPPASSNNDFSRRLWGWPSPKTTEVVTTNTEWLPFYVLCLLKALRQPTNPPPASSSDDFSRRLWGWPSPKTTEVVTTNFVSGLRRQPLGNWMRWAWERIRSVLSAERYALAAGLFAALTMYCEMTLGIFLGLFTLLYLAFVLAGRASPSPAERGRTGMGVSPAERGRAGVGVSPAERGRAGVGVSPAGGGGPGCESPSPVGDGGGLGWGLARRLAILAITAAVLYLPVLLPTLRELLAEGYALEGWGGADFLSADLLGFFTPTILHPLWGQWAKQATTQFADINTVFLGYLAPALSVFAVVRYRRRLTVWTVTVLTSAVLALGPLLHVNGRTLFDLDGLEVSVPLPFIILHYLPIVQANRVPNRFSVLLTLALAVLVGFAVADLLSRVRRRPLVLGLAGLLAFLLVFESLAVPLPLTDARVPDVYRQIASEPGDFAILQLPLGWRNSFGTLGAESTQLQYYQTVHGKRLLNGNIGRNPPFEFAYFARIPIFKSITGLEMYQEVSPEQREQDRRLAPEVAYFFDLRYVILHPALPGRLPYADTQARTEAYVRQVLPLEPQPFYAQDGVVAYRVRQPAAQSDLRLDIGTEAALLYQGEGWGRNEEIAGMTANWAVARQARLFVPLRDMGDYTLTIGALPLAYPGSPPQTMTVQVNGHRLPDRLTLAPAWTPYTVTVPARLLHSGLNEIVLGFAWTAVPGKVLPGSTDARPLAAAVDFVRLQK